jgi:hypothetical protein
MDERQKIDWALQDKKLLLLLEKTASSTDKSSFQHGGIRGRNRGG